MELELWLINNLIDYEFILDKTLLIVSDKVFQVILSKEIEGEQKIFDEDFKLILDSNDINIIDEYKSDYFLFLFGGQWYYYQTNKSDPELNLFKYFGKAKQKRDLEYSFLGVHTGYELCNGSRLASDWVKKAKFLNIKNLGICELNTLAGSLKFQEECLKEKIKPIIGETIIVKTDSERYELKLFCKNEIGWKNLLNINAQINVFNDGYVTEQYLYEHNEGLIIVISCSKKLDERFLEFINCFVTDKEDVYFQIDTVQYSSNEKDKDHLLNIQNYLRRFSGKNLLPVFICDAYYLDQEDYKIKNLINKIGKVGFKYQSKDQYFKSIYDIENQLRVLFVDDKDDGQQFIELFEQCLENTNKLANECNFLIDTDNFHLPKYVLSESEKKIFKNNEDLFWDLIQQGFDKKIAGKVENEDIYWQRIENEVKVIKEGDIIDYFLILADIINWCHRNRIIVGVGRGSSAGSLIAYLINIVELDPIKYDLLFERFLNEARIKAGEMVDIDSDFESSRRGDVKKYMEERYGIDHVASIGTYGNFKCKSIIKDFGREMSLDFSETNFITSLINEATDEELIELFKESNQEPKLKDFINKNFDLINKINLVLWQPKNQSIHASATLIVPFEDEKGLKKNIYDWLPVKKIDGMLITEWEGKEVENAGFLKEDILATLQLEKFRMIIDLIKKNHNIDIDWTKDIDVEEKEIYDTIWKTGRTEDIFQFTTHGLKAYCKFLKPDRFEDLIAANALARPGAMMSNAHIHYAEIKRGEKEIEYDFLLEEVTKDTFGLYIYQESIMKAFQVITESTLEEADMFRKIITKLKSGVQNDENFNRFKKLFVDSYVKKGSSEENAIYVWDKLVAFASYGFNKCIFKDSKIEYYCNINKRLTTRTTIKELFNRFKNGKEIYVKTYSKGKFIPSKVKNIFYTGEKQLYELKINYHNLRIFTSKDHKFLSHSGWKRLEDLNVGEEIFISRKEFKFEITDKIRKIRSKNLSKLNKTKEFRKRSSESMKKTMKKRIKNGEASKHTKRLHKEGLIDTSNLNKYGSAAVKKKWEEDYDGMKKKSWEPWHKASIETGKKGSKLEKQLFQYLKKLLPNGNWKRHQVRKINGSWLQFDIYSNIYNCFIEFDGIVHRDPIFGKEHLEKVKKKDKLKNEYIINEEKSIMIRVLEYSNSDTLKVANQIKDSINNKSLKQKEVNYFYNCEGQWKQIKSIKKKFIDETYDIEVENKEHNYIANGFVVHNSHAACYSYEAWVCSWFKFYYPLEFWVTSLKYSKEEDIEKKILEITQAGKIELKPPHINISGKEYTYDLDNQIIYWALDSIKFAGDKSVENIIKEREENGNFKSFKDFLKRVEGKRINKKVITNFILCGCFDQLEKIDKVTGRLYLLKEYLGNLNEEEFNYEATLKEYFWLMKQKELCGIGYIDFKKIYEKHKSEFKNKYISFEEMSNKENIDKHFTIVGVIGDIKDLPTKRGKAAILTLNENGRTNRTICWNDFWQNHESEIKSNKGRVMILSGTIKSFRNNQDLQTNQYSKFKII